MLISHKWDLIWWISTGRIYNFRTKGFPKDARFSKLKNIPDLLDDEKEG